MADCRFTWFAALADAVRFPPPLHLGHALAESAAPFRRTKSASGGGDGDRVGGERVAYPFFRRGGVRPCL